MRYRCIVCKINWGDDPEFELLSDGSGEEIFSDGLCQEHQDILLIKGKREKQQEEGNFDCCGRSKGFCSQVSCRHRWLCMSPNRLPEEVINETIQRLEDLAMAEFARKQARLIELHGEVENVLRYSC